MEKNSFIGVDISKKTLDVAIYQPGVKYTTYPHIQVKNNETGFNEIIQFLKKNDVTLKDAVIGMENTGICERHKSVVAPANSSPLTPNF